MPRVDGLICDIDGTLVHEHRDGDSTIVCGKGRGIARSTVGLLERLRGCMPVMLATGRRRRTFEGVRAFIPHDMALLEHGSVIIGRDGNIDQGWTEYLAPWIGSGGRREGPLWDFERALQAEGFRTDSDGRVGSFHIHPGDGCVRTDPRYVALQRRVLPDGLKLVFTYGQLVECFTSAAGKLNALCFLAVKLGLNLGNIAAIGDDTNDLDLFDGVGQPYTIASAFPVAREAVERRGGFVARAGSHEGIAEVLTHILGISEGVAS